jgi:hypothetical protein
LYERYFSSSSAFSLNLEIPFFLSWIEDSPKFSGGLAEAFDNLGNY